MAKTELGVLLDCSRNAVISTEGLKRFLPYLEKMGYNYLYLYTEDTYEICNEPLFGYMRGGYSVSEIKEADRLCRAHNVELRPCIQTLAHTGRLFSWRKFADIRDTADILLADDEKTYAFIDKMFASAAQCFTSRNIHIGMDEAYLLGRGRYADRHGFRDSADIFYSHLKRVCEIAEKYGFTPTIWSDMLFRKTAGGNSYADMTGDAPGRTLLPENLRIAYWDYFEKDERVYSRKIRAHKAFGRDITFAGGAISWCGFHSANHVSLDRIPKAIRACRRNGIGDILMTVWGDNGGECPFYAVLPSLFYAAECARGEFSPENAKEKFARTLGENWDDFLLFDLRMPPDITVQDDIASGAKEFLYCDYFNGRFDSTVRENCPEREIYRGYAERFTRAAENSRSFGYLFECYALLCGVLYSKYDLGAVTRAAYRRKDIKALKALLNRYAEVLRRIEKFAATFEKAWFYNYKPNGFDVQDLRLGGIIMRTKSCMRRIDDYVNGKITKIDELETPLADYYGGEEFEKKVPFLNCYTDIATANKL